LRQALHYRLRPAGSVEAVDGLVLRMLFFIGLLVLLPTLGLIYFFTRLLGRNVRHVPEVVAALRAAQRAGATVELPPAPPGLRIRELEQAEQSLLEAFRHYVSVKALGLLGTIFRKRLIRGTHNVAQVQKSFLLQQLRDNARTEYGRKYDFASAGSVEEFQRLHPLTRYDHYAPYVQRMMEGEGNVLTRQPPELFGVSSGTSGEGSKIIPMLRKQQVLFFLHAVSILYCCLLEAFPESGRRLRKSLKIFYNPAWRTSKAGIKIGPKPGQTELLTWWVTTDDLKAGSDMLDNFPGGYRDVVSYMKLGLPWVRFKFVKPGEELGMAFDGLVWVNDHWAWMPKPWRMLD